MGSIPISVPYPSGSFVRHIADIKVDLNGKIFIVAALDTDNNDGPFASAYYSAGQLKVSENGRFDFVKEIVKFEEFLVNKAEALEILPDGEMVFGTDDENKGGSLLVKSANKAEVSRYPAHWFAPVNDPKKPGWEILPQEARAREVILSKRNELGLLSNFAPTPFTYRGKRYASLEGFWQMMLYPEDAKDPRKKKGVEWKFTREQVAQMTAFEAKAAGTLAEENMKKMGIDWVSFEGKRFPYRPAAAVGTDETGEHYRLIVEAMRAKMEQNPEVKRVLLQTGDLVLKPDHHGEPNAPAAWRYNEIWMKFRAELQQASN